jgi:hypothetical protein
MMRRASAVLFCFGLAVLAAADDHGNGKAKNGDDDDHGYARGKGHGDEDESDHGGARRKGAYGAVVFRPDDRRAISDYYARAGESNLPPGLAKRNGDLPPGLAKQLRRNGRLPPGLEKRITPFPPELDRRLPPLPAGYYRGVIGDQAVVYDPRTSAILDVLNIVIGVTRGR